MAELSPTREQLAAYRASARARAAEREEARARRRDLAWEVARRAAALLRAEFGASRVVVFGSLATGVVFDDRSDIDLAAWGVPYEELWRASGSVAAIDTRFVVDFVRAEEASPGLVGVIERESVEL